MKLKAILFLTPLAVVLTFAQAYFWVPTYESQTTGNPDRVHKFIEASIGDAKILNPILHADVSSGRIVDLVFDGLLALDENLNLRGRLATKWRISETAYLMVVPGVLLADGTPGSAPRLEAELRSLIQKTPALASLVSDIRRERAHSRVEQVPAGGSGENARTLSVNLRIPERIAFTLTRVDQDFFTRLAPVIGDEYGRQFDHRRLVDGAAEAIPDRALREIAARAPVFEHNPVIEFELRRGVRFHDGHEFDAEDVKFTYEAIMSPHSLSPRTSDFEPIKRIELPSPHSLRVVYKRLFSPAINAWTMGILPQHLLGAPA